MRRVMSERKKRRRRVIIEEERKRGRKSSHSTPQINKQFEASLTNSRENTLRILLFASTLD
jgi:hypothetical protein